ncbi:hypothetical protein SPRG_16808 [Saprolegnia parasitica CBS 223.65]|uniref:Uncharacterized protein n=1 Tax=Saprolegnia parasitica (strain CBS 223.65) TaxID=695850 RepID=A0A067BI13_SAPPC|nr:hypothetical protein SPRG_16808 [Saprolegnia parasitica CBS 223.65]KDO17788.1 hypothetical protein SPRG_16808 [Saprolegnia parasitica CBS 223.65]|eukprot:XP_012211504.1 hypothetical protein SPRG_16808 [Saprolegnia parasitica CBS 223.65]
MFFARLLALWRSARAYDTLPAKSPFSYATSSSNDDGGIVDDGDATMVSLLKEGNVPVVLHRLQHRTYTLQDLSAIENGDSVLSYACELGRLDIVTLLLDTTPFTSIPEYAQYILRSITRAMHADHVSVLKLLLARIPDIIHLTAKLEGGGSLLHYAALYSATDVVAWLLPLVGDVDRTDDEGNTPLHIAARHNNTSVITLLLKAGADIDARNKVVTCLPNTMHTADSNH